LRRYVGKIPRITALALRSLLQHKLRAALSILGIVCGVAAVLVMLSIGEGAKRTSLRQIEQLGTKNIYIKALPLTEVQEVKTREKLSQGLSSYDAERLVKGCPSVADVACMKEIKASLKAARLDVAPQVVAVSASYRDIQNLSLEEGRFITAEDISNWRQVCVLGGSIADSLGLQGRTGRYVRIENHLFKIVGILKKYDNKTTKSSVVAARNFNGMLFVPLSTDIMFPASVLQKAPISGEGLTELIVRMRTSEEVFSALPLIRRIVEVTHRGANDYQIVVPRELLNQARKTQQTFNIVLGSIAFISLLVGGIGIMNIMLATVSERTREVGIRRALGATYEDIIVQFLAESVLLTSAGGLIGIVAGTLGVWLISAMAAWSTAITVLSVALPFFMSVMVGIFFGLYPAYMAAHMDPIAALRYE
jgi:putative ABC transport system permease protein